MKTRGVFSRRDFIKKTSTASVAFSIIPSKVLGGRGVIPPSDKLNVALVGSGSQALKMLPGWLKRPELQFVSVVDPNKESYDYPNWGKSQGELSGLPGGRDVGRHRIEEFYAAQSGAGKYRSVSTHVDFREMLEKEKDINAVFIMTPDHLHAAYAIMAMKKGIAVAAHKPVGNFMKETRVAIETAKSTKVPTHMFAFQDPTSAILVKEWIRKGVIGKVTELHRWTNRPMWPQGSPYLPASSPVPSGFDWDTWLGPSLPRPYSPAYTHTVFRGWYEFGAGCLADMGYYAFLVDWRTLNLGLPTVAEGCASVVCEVRDFRSTWVKNNLSYPHAAVVRLETPVNDTGDKIDVFWYEGGIKPIAPKEYRVSGKTMTDDGIMIVGEKGIIINPYNDPVFLGVNNAEALRAEFDKNAKNEKADIDTEMITYFKGGKESRGSYPNNQNVAEAICLGNLAIRMDSRLEWDPRELKVTNIPEANEYVTRKYREGWEM